MYGLPNKKRAAYRAAVKDGDFLRSLAQASLDELKAILENVGHKQTPRWKRVATRRAIARKEPGHSLSWVLGLDELKLEYPHMSERRKLIYTQTVERLAREEGPTP